MESRPFIACYSRGQGDGIAWGGHHGLDGDGHAVRQLDPDGERGKGRALYQREAFLKDRRIGIDVSRLPSTAVCIVTQPGHGDRVLILTVEPNQFRGEHYVSFCTVRGHDDEAFSIQWEKRVQRDAVFPFKRQHGIAIDYWYLKVCVRNYAEPPIPIHIVFISNKAILKPNSTGFIHPYQIILIHRSG
ncbi:hypothetical protein SDC9_128259 [bioreactor metagenome]|uniref:Uncharacterized protein n=1 Tax=bioreactor metagenome TaxID=1076179 RepID=A0A645CWB2_9ZZZZ